MKMAQVFNRGVFLALLVPFAACTVQWMLWDGFIKPYVWFLFFPAAFLSAWIGNLPGGLLGTAFSALLVWYVYIPPRFNWQGKGVSAVASTLMFLVMGAFFAWMFERLEQSRRRATDALKAAEAANREVTRLYERTLELDNLKSQFFANVSHELRTPLTLILAPLERQLADPELWGPAREEAGMMLRNAQLLYRHVCNLLDTAKIESGSMRLHYSCFDLAINARLLASHFDFAARERRIRYQVEALGPVMIEADSERIDRILLNLLSNAFKFTPDDGLIQLSVAVNDGQAVIEVADSGPGVPPAMRQMVFERFRQVDGSLHRCHGGVGLGLAIVRDLAELHHGEVSVTESSQGGALFCVRLPLAAPQGSEISDGIVPLDRHLEQQAIEEGAAPHFPAPAWDCVRDSAPLILVVEDNPDMNSFIAGVLGRQYRVVSATDGRSGLEKARTLKPDLVVTDVMMPGLSGDEMIQEMRRDLQMAETPVVAITARSDDAMRLKLFQIGVQGFLAKPFSVEELQTRVEHLLANRQRNMERLMQSDEELKQLRFALDHVSNFVFIKDRQLRYLYANQRTLNLFGCTMEELKGSSDEPFFPAQAVERIRAIDSRVLEGQNTAEEVQIDGEDGTRSWYLDIKTPIYASDDSSRPIALLGISADITRSVCAEEEARLLNADLELRVVERTAELSAANQELEAFAYSVSHDLRAPLRAISGFVAALEEDYGDQLESEARGYLNEVVNASKRMGLLIDGLLKVSRSTRGDLQREELNLTQLAEEVLAQLAAIEPARGVHWEVEPGLTACGDRTMLLSVMENLLGNAWKYTAHNPEAHIRVYRGTNGGSTRFYVADNGAGFDMTHYGNLFKPFQRLHRQEEFPGIGIGLATVQRIVRRHGGDMTAEGQVGHGATFSFTLCGQSPHIGGGI